MQFCEIEVYQSHGVNAPTEQHSEHSVAEQCCRKRGPTGEVSGIFMPDLHIIFDRVDKSCGFQQAGPGTRF